MKQQISDFVTILLTDRRKTGTLGVLMLALLVIGARSFLSLGPESSSASGGEGMNGSPAELGQSALSRTFELLNRMQNGQVTVVPRSPRLSHDLFGVNPESFPPPVSAVQVIAVKPERIEPVIKSPEEQADEIRAREVAQIHEAADRLSLRSVMVGQNTFAVFEMQGGKRSVVPVNGMISGFELKEVTTESVVVEKDAVQVRLWLTVPQR